LCKEVSQFVQETVKREEKFGAEKLWTTAPGTMTIVDGYLIEKDKDPLECLIWRALRSKSLSGKRGPWARVEKFLHGLLTF
jgi:hypothetical protein